jgi:hypothetical protein
LAFYQVDPADYLRRFDTFREFYRGFYGNTREYSDDPAQQYDLFDIPDHPVTVIGFNSCYQNDLLRRAASINADAMAAAARSMRSPQRRNNLAIAVWHHNTRGGPEATDYLDAEHVQFMIDRGISLGLHGHHHRPLFLNVHFDFGSDRTMVVAAAGTLCGHSAPKYGRSYNIVELDLQAWKGRLHVREVGNDIGGMPIWRNRVLPVEPQLYYEFGISPPPVRDVDPRSTQLVQAQSRMEAGRYDEARGLLLPISTTPGLARRLLLECLVQLRQNEEIAGIFAEPESVTESIHLMDALWETHAYAGLRKLLQSEAIALSTEPTIVELRTKYSAKLKARDA